MGRRLETELSLCEKDLAISFVANAIDGVRIRIQVKTGTTVESEYVVTVKEYKGQLILVTHLLQTSLRLCDILRMNRTLLTYLQQAFRLLRVILQTNHVS